MSIAYPPLHNRQELVALLDRPALSLWLDAAFLFLIPESLGESVADKLRKGTYADSDTFAAPRWNDAADLWIAVIRRHVACALERVSEAQLNALDTAARAITTEDARDAAVEAVLDAFEPVEADPRYIALLRRLAPQLDRLVSWSGGSGVTKGSADLTTPDTPAEEDSP